LISEYFLSSIDFTGYKDIELNEDLWNICTKNLAVYKLCITFATSFTS